MVPRDLTFTLILLIATTSAEAQCNGTAIDIKAGNGTIESPNFMGEYGEIADCIWRFNLSQTDTMLIMNIVWQRIYFFNKYTKEKYCHGHHNLTINHEPVECTRRVKPGDRSAPNYCKAFYESSTCRLEKHSCEDFNRISTPVEVEYSSNGVRDGKNIGPVWGFQMEYNFVKCKPEAIFTTTQVKDSTAENDGDSTTQPGFNSIMVDTSTKSADVTFAARETGSKTLKIAFGVFGGLLFSLIVIIVARKRRRAQQKTGRKVTGISFSSPFEISQYDFAPLVQPRN